jgi:hypothetical protein
VRNRILIACQVDAKPSTGRASSIILGSEDCEISRPIDDAFVVFEKATIALRTETGKYEVELANREAIITAAEMSMKDCETRLEQQQKEHDQDKERLAKQESRIKDLEEECVKQGKQILDLQGQVKLTTNSFSTQALTIEPTEFAPELSLKASQTFQDAFDPIPDGENAGMFMEKQRQSIMIGEKKFERIRILQPFLAIKGTPDSELDMSCGRFGSIKYTTPDGSYKLVEIFGPNSLVQYNGRFMIQWVVLKELDYTI